MHEATIAQSILAVACDRLSKTKDSSSVVKVKVVIGEFRNVDCDSLLFAFDGIKALHHGCQTATLELEMIPAEAFCLGNKHRYKPKFENAFRCLSCGAGIAELICGRELDVTGVTLAFEDSVCK